MALIYPSILPLVDVKETIIGKTVKTSFDNNYVQQRLKTTRIRRRFELNYMLNFEEYEVYENFFISALGQSFDITNPLTLNTYTVFFASDTLDIQYIHNNLIKISVTLEEV